MTAAGGSAPIDARVLTLNAGSSSIKFALFGSADGFARAAQSGQVEGIGVAGQGSMKVRAGDRVLHDAACSAANHAEALAAILDWLERNGGKDALAAVGHRIVHGGPDFDRPMRIDAALVGALAALEPLAPLHQPHNVAGVRAALEAFAGVPQVACFDTAFHRGQPEVHQHFALPIEYFDQGIRRYGFHGLSYESICAQLPTVARRTVIAHLGNGASVCALLDGRSVATTMSFSPLDGLTMGTRCGHLDAAVVLHLQRALGLSIDAVTTLLYRHSGLLGLSGLSSDMRALEASDTARSRLAIDHFVEQLLQGIASMAAALRGVDRLVFTGGIGENAAALRARVVGDCGWLGATLDDAANATGGSPISAAGSAVEVLVLRTDEEAVIARHTAATLGLQSSTLLRPPEGTT